MLGYGSNDGMKEYLRLYIALHGDHEGIWAAFPYVPTPHIDVQ